VSNGEYFRHNGTGGQLSNLSTNDGSVEITIMFTGTEPPTLLNSTNLRLRGAVDWSPTRNSMITLVKNSNISTGWYEKSRTEM